MNSSIMTRMIHRLLRMDGWLGPISGAGNGNTALDSPLSLANRGSASIIRLLAGRLLGGGGRWLLGGVGAVLLLAWALWLAGSAGGGVGLGRAHHGRCRARQG